MSAHQTNLFFKVVLLALTWCLFQPPSFSIRNFGLGLNFFHSPHFRSSRVFSPSNLNQSSSCFQVNQDEMIVPSLEERKSYCKQLQERQIHKSEEGLPYLVKELELKVIFRDSKGLGALVYCFPEKKLLTVRKGSVFWNGRVKNIILYDPPQLGSTGHQILGIVVCSEIIFEDTFKEIEKALDSGIDTDKVMPERIWEYKKILQN